MVRDIGRCHAAAIVLAQTLATIHPVAANPNATKIISVLNVPNPSNVPLTRKNHVVEIRKYATPLGLLRCTPALDDCIVNNMPLVTQYSLALAAEMKNYLKSYEDPTTPGVLRKELKFGGGQATNAYTIAILNNGCLLTSMTTIISTALANREPNLKLINRTLQFDSIAPTKDAPQKIQAQVAWSYKRAFESWNGFKSGGKAVEVFAFEEVAADIAGGKPGTKTPANCDPYDLSSCTAVAGPAGSAAYYNDFSGNAPDSNTEVIGGMKKQSLYLLAYGRYASSTAINPATKALAVTFKRTSQHKVVVRGFQPGAFPLLINDIGSGKQVRARLSKDLSTLKFGTTRTQPQTPMTYGSENGKPFAGRPFLVYEGDDEGANPTVFFLDEVHVLHIKTAVQIPLKQ